LDEPMLDYKTSSAY